MLNIMSLFYFVNYYTEVCFEVEDFLAPFIYWD